MIKSELIDRISVQNPHLYRQDAEKIVNTIFSEITAAMARGDRVELRGFGAIFCKGPGRPDRTKSSHRGSGFGRKQSRSLLQERKGNEVSAELTCARLRYRPGSRHGPLTAHPVRDRRVVERRHRKYTRHRQLSGPTLYAAQRRPCHPPAQAWCAADQVIRIQPVRRTLPSHPGGRRPAPRQVGPSNAGAPL